MITPNWFKDIHFAFSKRGDGQMSLKNGALEEVIENRNRFLKRNRLPLGAVTAPELVHKSGVAVVTAQDVGRGAFDTDWIPEVDALVTDEPDILLMTTHADCAPLVIYDPEHQVLGQAHAGWRSLAGGIVENLVTRVRSFNGASPTTLYAWIGPTVRSCCYQVGLEVATQFPEDCQRLVGDSLRLDLPTFIIHELQRLHFKPEHVTDSRICTSCNPEFSSFRREKKLTAAMALVTGLKSS